VIAHVLVGQNQISNLREGQQNIQRHCSDSVPIYNEILNWLMKNNVVIEPFQTMYQSVHGFLLGLISMKYYQFYDEYFSYLCESIFQWVKMDVAIMEKNHTPSSIPLESIESIKEKIKITIAHSEFHGEPQYSMTQNRISTLQKNVMDAIQTSSMDIQHFWCSFFGESH